MAIVALTRYDDSAFVDELLSAGARGYVLKQSRSVELLNAIRAAARGQRYIDTALAGRRLSRKPHLGMPIISQREETILRLLASGHRNKDIATSLGHQHQDGRGAPIQRDVQARTARSPRCDALCHAQGLVGGAERRGERSRSDRDSQLAAARAETRPPGRQRRSLLGTVGRKPNRKPGAASRAVAMSLDGACVKGNERAHEREPQAEACRRCPPLGSASCANGSKMTFS